MRPTIYHGTPLTPRAALLDVLRGRAGCVSFYRPDDAEAVEAVCPQIMFRSRRVFILASRYALRAGMGSGKPQCVVAGLFRMAGATPVLSWTMGDCPGQSRRTIADQRRASQRLSVRQNQDGPGMAHGRLARAPRKAMREVRPCLPWMGGRSGRSKAEGRRLRCLHEADGRSGSLLRQQLASIPHAARRSRGASVSIRGGRCNEPRTEWASL